VATLGGRSEEFPTGDSLSDFLEWFCAEVAAFPTTFMECNENITCYSFIVVFQMLVGEGSEHLPELKNLALSCDALVLQDFPVEADRIAKRLVKNWWTKHCLPYCMQKIEEENRVSSATLLLRVDWRISLSKCLFLTSPKQMRISEAVTAMRVSRLPVMARRQKFWCEGLPQLGRLGMMLKRRRMCPLRFSWLMQSLLRRCECFESEFVFRWVVFCLGFK
jgi:hypothetical protein